MHPARLLFIRSGSAAGDASVVSGTLRDKRNETAAALGIAWLSIIEPCTQMGQSSGGIAVAVAVVVAVVVVDERCPATATSTVTTCCGYRRT